MTCEVRLEELEKGWRGVIIGTFEYFKASLGRTVTNVSLCVGQATDYFICHRGDLGWMWGKLFCLREQ